MRTYKDPASAAAAAFIALSAPGLADRVFFEDFEGIGEATPINAGNTDFATVDLQGLAADILARDPDDEFSATGDFFGGSDYADLLDLGAGSVFLQANLPGLTLFSARIEFHEPSGIGDGTDLVIRTDNGGTSSPSVDLRLDDGRVYHAFPGTGARTDTGVTYSLDTSYHVDIVVNAGETGSESYTDPEGTMQSIDAQTFDVWLTSYDGGSTIPVLGLDFRNTDTMIDRFLIQTFSSQDNQLVFFDKVQVFDEPTVISSTPQIVSQPLSQAVPDGTGLIELAVGADGIGPFTYQWKLGGVDVPDATEPTLLIDTPDSGKAGDYTVVVTNAADSTTSDPATVTLVSSDCSIIEKFDGLAAGPLSGGGWTVQGIGYTAEVVDGGGDHYLAALDDDGAQNEGIFKSLLGASPGIPDGSTGTLFARVYLDSSTDDSLWFGVGASGGGFNQFEAYLTFQSDGGVNVRDGGANVATTTTLTPDTWYNVWIVVDNATNRYRVFLKSADASATLADMLETAEGASSFGFRNGTAGTLSTVQLIARSTVSPFRTDEIFVCANAELALPPLGIVTPLGPLTIGINGSGDAVLTWPGPGVLQHNPTLIGAWTDVDGGTATSPHIVTDPLSGHDFFRLRD